MEIDSESTTTSASESESAPKRQKLQAEKGKHAPGYKKEWEREFTWLEPVRNENIQVIGLICDTSIETWSNLKKRRIF